jgi:hypothetical protein
MTTPTCSQTTKFEEVKKLFGPGNLFVDFDFPPNAESLGKLEGDTAAGNDGRTDNKIYWERPQVIQSNQI